MTAVVVIGGGVAGLVVARDLAKGGADVVLVEAGPTLGGMVRRHTVAGIDLDMAADSYATRTDAVATLATELGLGNDLVVPDPRGAWLMTRDGRAVPMPATSMLGIPSVPMAADVIAVVGTGGAFRAQLDALVPSTVGARSTTLGELVRRRMGRAVLDDLVVPVTAGVHSAHPDDLPLDRVAPTLVAAMQREGSLARGVLALRERAPAGSAVGGIRGGIVRLVDELVADMDAYRVDVRIGTRAVRVDRASVDVVGPDGTTEHLVADHVVSTVPDPARQDPREREGIELTTLVVEQPELDAAPRGTGMLVHPDATGVHAKAFTHATVKWPWLAERTGGAHVLRLSTRLGPAEADAIGAGTSVALDPDSDLGVRAAADATAMTGVPIEPERVLGAARVRWHAPDTGDTALADGVVAIGEAGVGRGLAAVVGASRLAAERILDS